MIYTKNPEVLKIPLAHEFQEFIYKDFTRKFTVYYYVKQQTIQIFTHRGFIKG